LSYLKLEEQEWLYDILCREENFGVPMSQAKKMKGISQNGKLTYEKIDRIIISKNHEPPKAIKLSYKAIKDFFPPDTTPKEYEVVIQKALTEWFKRHPKRNQINEHQVWR
jgi:ParB family chromosome partitioning protein